MAGLIRAEWRRARSTRLWWALLVPIGVVSALVNAFGGISTAAVAGLAAPSLLPVSLAYALSLTSVFAVVYGVVAASGEFRHRTVTTTYLLAPRRGLVLAAKSVVTAGIGAVYALAAVVVGVVAGQLARPVALDVWPVLAVTGIAVVVVALWAVLGTALGIAVANLAAALAGALVYLLLGELVLAVLLNRAATPAVAALSAYLPGNAGDVALYDLPARALAGDAGGQAVEILAGVTSPPPWWVALGVLAGWTAVVVAAAAVIGGRRDIT